MILLLIPIGIMGIGYLIAQLDGKEEHPKAFRANVWQRLAGLEGKADPHKICAWMSLLERKGIVRGIDKNGYHCFESVNSDSEVIDFLTSKYNEYLGRLINDTCCKPGSLTPWEENYVAIQKLKKEA